MHQTSYLTIATLAIFCLCGKVVAQNTIDPPHNDSWHFEPEMAVAPQTDLHLTHHDTLQAKSVSFSSAFATGRFTNDRFAAEPFFHTGYMAFGTTLAYHSMPRLSFYLIGHKSITQDHIYGGFGSEMSFSHAHHHRAFAEFGSVIHELKPVLCVGASFDLSGIRFHSHKKRN